MNLKRKTKKAISIEDRIRNYFLLSRMTVSRSEILRKAAEMAVSDFGDYITPGNLKLCDEIHIIFVELLDQIVYEFRENNEYDTNIKDYIVDDLYLRLIFILEALENPAHYLVNLRNRALFYDDLVIIKRMNMPETVSVLVSEFEDFTHLQIPIITTLLRFTPELNLEFLYNAYRNSASGFIRAAALLGLKYSSDRGLNWETVRDASGSADYAEGFNLASLNGNPLPRCKEEMTFALLHTANVIREIDSAEDINWILELLNSYQNYTYENACLTEINNTLGNIIIGIDTGMFEETLQNEKKLINMARFIDRLPNSIFNRITGKLDDLGLEFRFNLNSVIEKKKVPVSDYNSNIISYLCLSKSLSF